MDGSTFLVPGRFRAKGNWNWDWDGDWEGYNDRIRDQERRWGNQGCQRWHAEVHDWRQRNASIGNHVDWRERWQAWHGHAGVRRHHSRVGTG